MKQLLLALCTLPLLTGCLATSGDLQRLADAQSKLEQVLEDRAASQEEVEGALEEYRDELAAVAVDVKARGEGLFDQLADPAAWTPAGLIGAAMWYFRNMTRRRDIAVERERPPAA